MNSDCPNVELIGHFEQYMRHGLEQAESIKRPTSTSLFSANSAERGDDMDLETNHVS